MKKDKKRSGLSDKPEPLLCLKEATASPDTPAWR